MKAIGGKGHRYYVCLPGPERYWYFRTPHWLYLAWPGEAANGPQDSVVPRFIWSVSRKYASR